MQPRQRILVFGGAFNPPTLAHEAIVRACLALPEFSEVWAMPSGDRLDKTIEASDADRLAMLRLVKEASFGGDPRLVVSDFELCLPRPTKTSSTVAALERAYPDNDFWFAYGADSYRQMPSWPDGATLQQKLRVVLFGRTSDDAVAGKKLHTIDLPDISATHIRHAAAAGKKLDSLVSAPVAHYLQQHRLYQT